MKRLNEIIAREGTAASLFSPEPFLQKVTLWERSNNRKNERKSRTGRNELN